ncbi:unnamed protein product [Effrenium voratum]|uniref:tRNA (cytosine(38)-C(5))-methyltransferase n=1 Tax=Effrenium voratum TaxID=2562239 RepID=A0AA36MMA2_9DINO|nr:unnamed protein product [Effrenium voratum]
MGAIASICASRESSGAKPRESETLKIGGILRPGEVGRVCELFAGIGGWRLALDAAAADAAGAPKLRIEAFDSGPHCSEVYLRNFGERCCRRNIEQLSPKDLDGFDLWLMSPPCQPFSTTREAKQRDLGDKRCDALSHLCKVLPLLKQPPRWIALENVKGFSGSDACCKWRAALREAGFRDREMILDLQSFGTPNHRTRYYLLAERETEHLRSAPKPRLAQQGEVQEGTSCSLWSGDAPTSISTFLEEMDEHEKTQLLVPLEVLSKPFAPGLSYVRAKDVRSFCFTGHYGKVMHKSSGSLLHLSSEAIDRARLPQAFGEVRLFSPKEILNFLGFPASFSLPGDMPLKHRYKVVGNSIAVTVAKELLKLLLYGQGAESLCAREQRRMRTESLVEW